MSSYRVMKNDGPAPIRGLAIGLDSGSLYMMLNATHGVVIVGRGVFTNREGVIVKAGRGRGVRFLPFGAVVEIEV